MSKFVTIQNNFLTGQIGGKSFSRLDKEEYYNGCEELTNFLPIKEGGVTKRAGTNYVLDSGMTNPPRLIPFIFSKTEAYWIAIDYVNGGTKIIISRNNNTAIGSIATLTLAPNDSTNPFHDDYNTVSWDKYGWHYTQAADVLFLAHSSGTVPPIAIIRTAAASFTVLSWLWASTDLPVDKNIFGPFRVPYEKRNITATTLARDTSNPVIITASTAIFSADWIGTYIQIDSGGFSHVSEVIGFTDTTHVTVTNVINPGSIGAVDTWRVSSWRGLHGYPRTVTGFEQRIYYGGTPSHPDTLYGSLVGNTFHFQEHKLLQDASSDVSGYNWFGDAAATDPIQYTPVSKEINSTQWLYGDNVLIDGTLGEEFIASGGDTILSNTSGRIKKVSSYGSKAIQPVKAGDNFLYVTKNGRFLRSFKYSEFNGSFESKDFNRFADDIIDYDPDGGSVAAIEIIDMVFQAIRSTVWLITSNYELISLTLDEESEIKAWARHRLGGTSTAGGAYTKVYGIAVVPSVSGVYDELWLATKRYINSTTEHYIERMRDDFRDASIDENDDNGSNATYLDCSWTGDMGAAVSGMTTELAHLKGETVQLLADGVRHADKTVDGSGAITFDSDARYIVAGLAYTPKVKTVPTEGGRDFQTTQGQIKRIDRATIRLYKSRKLLIGDAAEANFDTVPDTDDGFASNIYRVTMPQGHDKLGQIVLKHTEPYPLTILGFTLRGVTHD